MQEEYGMALRRAREIQRKNYRRQMVNLNKQPPLIKPSEINKNNYDDYEDRDEDFDENGVRKNLKDFLSR